MKYFILCLLLLLAGCASPLALMPRISPEGPHDQAADRALCLDYAERYGVINLSPMLGDKAVNQPDRRRRDHLFLVCMQEKGYRF